MPSKSGNGNRNPGYLSEDDKTSGILRWNRNYTRKALILQPGQCYRKPRRKVLKLAWDRYEKQLPPVQFWAARSLLPELQPWVPAE